MKRALLLALLSILCGCQTIPPCDRIWPQAHSQGPIHVAMYDQTPRCPTLTIRVFQPGEKVPPHISIALMTSGGNARDEGRFVGEMITHAKRIGATGFVLLPYEAPNATLAEAHPIWQNPGDRVYRANAILLTLSKEN